MRDLMRVMVYIVSQSRFTFFFKFVIITIIIRRKTFNHHREICVLLQQRQ